MEELIKLALTGNQDAYTKLIESIQFELYSIASARLDNIDDINDAIQETIIHSYEKLNTLNNPIFFKTWIIRILINECNLIYRKKKKQLGLFNKITDSVSSFYKKDNLENIENNIDFDILIKDLKYEERLIITLYAKNNFSPTEISNILNISVNTVKSRLTRAKKKLKKLYEEGGIYNEKRK